MDTMINKLIIFLINNKKKENDHILYINYIKKFINQGNKKIFNTLIHCNKKRKLK